MDLLSHPAHLIYIRRPALIMSVDNAHIWKESVLSILWKQTLLDLTLLMGWCIMASTFQLIKNRWWTDTIGSARGVLTILIISAQHNGKCPELNNETSSCLWLGLTFMAVIDTDESGPDLVTSWQILLFETFVWMKFHTFICCYYKRNNRILSNKHLH